MRDIFDNWVDDGFEHEIAHGHMGRQATNRALRKHRIAMGVLEIGRNVCFKKDAAPAPSPDPAIGQAAANNVELGKEWLNFSKDQFAKGEIRQDVYDDLIGKVVNSQIGAQDQANAWAQQDRDLGQIGKTQFDQLASQAGGTADKYAGVLNGIAGQYSNIADKLGGQATQFGNQAAAYGQQAANQYGFADKQQGRYSSTFAPIEDKIASDAMNWDSDTRLASEAAKARGDVLDSSARARASTERSMASMGINPLSGRFQGQQRANDITEALGAAGAENTVRDNVRMQAQQLRGQAAQVGQQVLSNSNTARTIGLQAAQAQTGATQSQTGALQTQQNAVAGQQGAVQAANGAASSGITQTGQLLASGLGAAGVGYQGLGVGLTAGNSAVGNQGAGQSSFIANNGIMGQGYNGAIGANTSAGGMLNNLYGNQLNAWGMQQQANATNSAGIGGMIGSLAGTGAALYL